MQRDEQFARNERILKRQEFRQIYDRGRRYHFPLFTIFALRNAQDRSRLGITVTRRTGSAVVRNRCKRLLREVFRRNKERFPIPMDVVVNARYSMVEATYAEVEAQFLSFIEKLGTESEARV